jgi:hypothetical protein
MAKLTEQQSVTAAVLAAMIDPVQRDSMPEGVTIGDITLTEDDIPALQELKRRVSHTEGDSIPQTLIDIMRTDSQPS